MIRSDLFVVVIVTGLCFIDGIKSVDVGKLVLPESATAFEGLNFVAEGSRVVTHVVFTFFALSSRVLDNRGDFLSLSIVHIKKHLLALTVRWLVVVDEQVTQDPLV